MRNTFVVKHPTISYLTDIYFESGALSVLPNLLNKLAITHPLIVTDPGLIATGLLDRWNFPGAPCFTDIKANPTESSVHLGLEAFRDNQCDGLVAVGGGSPIDCAKAIALLVHHKPPLEQYTLLKGGLDKITANRPKLVAIPTTAGTGSEVGRAALITFSNNVKTAIISPHLIPDAAICDPTLTLGLPKYLTAGTGMDALSHCIENFCSPTFNPVADAIALDGIKRAYANIQQAVHQGDRLPARTEMMMAALQGGLTFQKGLGLVHSLSHPLGGLTNKLLHHGTLNAIFLPHAISFNMDACPQKMDYVAAAVQLSSRNDLPTALEALNNAIGIPKRLRDLNVTQHELDDLAKMALTDHCSQTNPRPITLDDCERLYQQAF